MLFRRVRAWQPPHTLVQGVVVRLHLCEPGKHPGAPTQRLIVQPFGRWHVACVWTRVKYKVMDDAESFNIHLLDFHNLQDILLSPDIRRALTVGAQWGQRVPETMVFVFGSGESQGERAVGGRREPAEEGLYDGTPDACGHRIATERCAV